MSAFSFLGISPFVLGGSLLAATLLSVGLYLLRLRRRPLSVPFIELWERLILDRKASALRSQLRRWLSLLLTLFLAFALIFALADPRPVDEKQGRSLAVIVDVSASMAGQVGERTGLSNEAQQANRLQLAQEKLRTWLPSLGRGDEMLLIEMGARPRPLHAFTGDQEKLTSLIDDLHILDVEADLQAALLLAEQALRGRSAPEIILLSDGELLQPPAPEVKKEVPPLRFEYLGAQLKAAKNKNAAAASPGVQADESRADREVFHDSGAATSERGNSGISAFSARRYPLAGDRFEVLLGLFHEGKEPADFEVRIYSATPTGERGGLVELLQLTLQPGEERRLTFDDLDRADEGLIAELVKKAEPPEEFLADNLARTVLSARQAVRILVVGPPDNFLDAALLVENSLIVKRVAAQAYPPDETFDVTIFNGVFPPRNARTGAAIYLGAPHKNKNESASYPLEIADELSLFGFDTWKKDSPVFRLIDPYDVQVLSGVSLKAREGDLVLGQSQGRPILVEGSREQGRFLALGFSPQKSDFVLRSVWPLFVINMIDEMFPRGRGEILSTLQTGSSYRIPVLDVEAQQAEVTGPLRAQLPASTFLVPVSDGYAVFFGQEAGFFDVKTASGSAKVAASFFGTHNSSHAQPQVGSELSWGEKKAGPVVGMEARAHFPPWMWLLAGVFVISFIEWWAYHKRWTL